MFPAGRKRASELGDAQAKELQGRASARDAVINRFRKQGDLYGPETAGNARDNTSS